MVARHRAEKLRLFQCADPLTLDSHHVLTGKNGGEVVNCVKGVRLEAYISHHSFETLLHLGETLPLSHDGPIGDLNFNNLMLGGLNGVPKAGAPQRCIVHHGLLLLQAE